MVLSPWDIANLEFVEKNLIGIMIYNKAVVNIKKKFNLIGSKAL